MIVYYCISFTWHSFESPWPRLRPHGVTSAQHRTDLLVIDDKAHIGINGVPDRPGASMGEPSAQRVLVHTSVLSAAQPLPRATSLASSAAVQSRAPVPAQALWASLKVAMLLKHIPSLFDWAQTRVLPNLNFQPSASQVFAERITVSALPVAK